MDKSASFIKSKSLRSFSFSVIGMFLLLMFQNCGQEYDDSNTSIDSSENAYAQGLPFAFNFDIDQIGYMSCNGESLDADSRFFSFKAGAYNEDSGVSLRGDFRGMAEAGRLFGKKMADALFASERNSGAGLVLALRSSANLQSTVGSTSKTVGGVFFDRGANLSLSQTNVAEQLVNAITDQKINSFNLPGLSKNRNVDGAITFPISEGGANTIRNRISSNEYLLSLTYGTATGENDAFPGQRARSQYDPNGLTTDSGQYVFGKGYNLQFYQYDVNVTGSPSRAVTGVSRNTNLENRQGLGEDWICPDDEKYIIVKPSDAYRGYPSGSTFLRKNDGPDILLGQYDNLTYISNINDEPGEDGVQVNGCVTGADEPDAADEDCIIRTNELYVSRVLCPLYPDDVPAGNPDKMKWKRVRNMLPHKDWYVFRGVDNGVTYNCVVPKGGGESCYGEANKNTNPSIVVQYLRNETYPGYPDDVRPRIESNCGTGTQKFCPHILSICHKR